jgi:hypothetical protein
MLMDVAEVLQAVDANYDFLRQHYAEHGIENVVVSIPARLFFFARSPLTSVSKVALKLNER